MRKSVSNLVVPENNVLLHCVERSRLIPSASPFVLKLETYLRMAKIEYQIDNKRPFAPSSGKTPWITFNGSDIADSHIIIDFLNKKFNKNLWGKATEEEIALARMTRITLEDHFNWGMVQWRWVQNIDKIGDLVDFPALKLRIAKFIMPRRIKSALFAQGLGRHPYETLVKMIEDDLRDISKLLGSKKFFLGDEPTEIDCTIFGFLAQAMWGMPGSPYEKLVNELNNLKQYTMRMKETYWADFDEILPKPKH